ncbi:serine racemase-like [Convolutriloba macropyga]|uniref:serine racemase-like n=1 Tax=Convolutriloba macropyga TaxID=536237 RepID=UPI003F521C6B
MLVDNSEIEAALERIKHYIHQTPILTSQTFEHTFCPGKNIFFKCDNFQKCGSFKIRGALNAVMKLKEREPDVEAVVTHSSGNFAQALAYAAKLTGVSCYVVCPSNTVQAKKDAAKEYGAHVTECEPTEAAREEGANAIIQSTGAVFVHPYAHPDIICGQGTAGLEMISQVRQQLENGDIGTQIDAVLVPVGGGGLLSGISTAIKYKYPNAKVFAVEPETANDAKRSFDTRTLTPNENYPTTICDGLRTSMSEITFNHMMANVDNVMLVSDEETAKATRFLLSRMKMCVEPSGAVGVAALMNDNNVNKYLKGLKNIVVFISGGNFDFLTQSDLINQYL